MKRKKVAEFLRELKVRPMFYSNQQGIFSEQSNYQISTRDGGYLFHTIE